MSTVYSVSQINNYIKNMFTSDYLLNNLYLKGEVSNVKYHSSGHIYFTIKDEESAIAAVMFKGSIKDGLKFKLLDGQQVILLGNISIYERDGKYQIYVKEIILDGLGALYDQYEQLKQRLYEEGLFEFDLKKPIPKFPKTVGIVTARTGAAIRDIVNIAQRRNPYVQLILYPAKVQGENAALSIVKGIEKLDSMNVDTIIIGRGGGSIEDLWAFNEEIVARAIYNAKTPIISGTGHETDNTIADYAADLRAPTPSAACELAIPDIVSQLEEITRLEDSLFRTMNNRITKLKLELANYEIHIKHGNPEIKIAQQRIYADELSDKLSRDIKNKYINSYHKYELLLEKLNGLSPTAKLINGFGYIENENKEPVLSVNKINIGEKIEATISDGSIISQVIEVKEK